MQRHVKILFVICLFLHSTNCRNKYVEHDSDKDAFLDAKVISEKNIRYEIIYFKIVANKPFMGFWHSPSNAVFSSRTLSVEQENQLTKELFDRCKNGKEPNDANIDTTLMISFYEAESESSVHCFLIKIDQNDLPLIKRVASAYNFDDIPEFVEVVKIMEMKDE